MHQQVSVFLHQTTLMSLKIVQHVTTTIIFSPVSSQEQCIYGIYTVQEFINSF